MNKKKFFVIFGIITLIIFLIGSYYVKKKYYDPWQRLSESKEKSVQLVKEKKIKEGDILFQVNKSSQTKAIQQATNSAWSHVGMVFKKDGELVVYEAVQPVKITPLANWLARSVDGVFAVMRLKDSDNLLDESTLLKLRDSAGKQLGKNYDIYFEWSDTNMYCSEYVWKVYDDVLGIQLGKKQKLREFDLSGEEVKTIMKKRYGDSPPLDEDVISPQAIYISDKLIKLYP